MMSTEKISKSFLLLKCQIKWVLFYLNINKFKEFHFLPFDLNKPLLPTALEKLCQVHSELIVKLDNARISDGTLLGLLRDKNLIKHDNDIDFDIEYSESNISEILSYAKLKKWQLGRQVIYSSRIQQLLFYDQDYEIFDFIFWSVDDRFAINFSEPRCFRIMPKSFLTNLTTLMVKEIEFQVPFERIEWLHYRYGSNWNVPETKKSHFAETCGDLGTAWWL